MARLSPLDMRPPPANQYRVVCEQLAYLIACAKENALNETESNRLDRVMFVLLEPYRTVAYHETVRRAA